MRTNEKERARTSENEFRMNENEQERTRTNEKERARTSENELRMNENEQT